MKRILTILLVSVALFSGYAMADGISVIEKETVGIQHDVDFRLRVFRLCIGGQEFVQTFAVCPMKGSVNSNLKQVFEEVNGNTLPKKCKQY